MHLDPPSPELAPASEGARGGPDPPGPNDGWLGDLLLACDAARAAGIAPADLQPSPHGSSVSEFPPGAERLALARACLDQLHRRWPWPGAAPERESSSGPLAGLNLKLGRYTLITLIGSGGHGLVFLANDPTLDRRVALKIPRPEWLSSERYRARFLREAHALARLDHPCIVPIHDFGESGSICYLATAFVDGPSLADWLASRQGRVEPETAASLVLQLAEAVAHAHSRGVLHRDLKPGNVLMDWSAAGAAPVPRVTDFGLAKLLDEARDEHRTDTLPFGTPRYMAPEQAAGDRARVGPATDVYGLGGILHAILTGDPPRCPFESWAALPIIRPDLPDSLRQIVARSLRRAPEDRYQTPTELAGDLKRFLAGERVAAPRLGRGSLRRGWDELRKGNRIAIAALVLSLVLSVVGMAVLARRQFAQTKRDSLSPVAGRSHPNALPTGPDLTEDEYRRDIRRARQLIVDVHQIRDVESEWLDRWSGPFRQGQTDFRGLEWGILKNLAHREWFTLRHGVGDDGKPAALYAVRFSPDGTRSITAGKDGTARIWDAATGKCLKILSHGKTEVNVGVFSPDAKLAATCSDDGFVRLWDCATSRLVHSFSPPHSDLVSFVRFTPDGGRLVSVSHDGNFAVWDVATGRSLARRAALVGKLESLAIASDGAFALAGGQREGRIAILDLDNYSLRWHLRSGGAVSALDLASDNRWVALTDGKDVALVDLTGRSPERKLRDHRGPVRSVALAPDRTFVASIGTDNDFSVRIWNAVTGRVSEVLPGHTNGGWCIAVSPDGRRLATASDDGTAKIWDLERRPDRTVVPAPPGAVPLDVGASFESESANEWGERRTKLLMITAQGDLESIAAGDGRTWTSQRAFSGPIVAARLGPDGRKIAGVSNDGSLTIADVAGNKTAVIPDGLKIAAEGFPLAFDLQGQILVTRERSTRDLLAIDTLSGRIKYRLASRSAGLEASDLTFFSDGLRVASLNLSSGKTFVWDLGHARAHTSERQTPNASPVSIAVSPKGNLLATGDLSERIQFIDADTLALTTTLLGHSHGVVRLAFSPDGRRLASGDTSGTVKLWDVATGEELVELPGLGGGARFLRFAPDGLTLVGATVENGGRFVVWHGRPHPSETADQTR